MSPVGVVLGKRESYTAEEIAELRRRDLRPIAIDLGVEGADEWLHPYWNGERDRINGKRREVWKLKRAEMIAKIVEALP